MILITSIGFYSCDSDDNPIRQPDSEYFPLRKGFYQVYQVEETLYELGVAQMIAYELKTVVTDSFKNAEGNYTYIMHRSRKDNGTESWVPVETWSASITADEVILTEGSTAYVVLHFPVAMGVSWNGNLYNNELNPTTNTREDIYSVISTNNSCNVNDISLADCVTVEQENNQEFIVYQDLRRDVYSRNIGLVFREKMQLQYCTDEDRGCVGQQIIDSGIIYKQQIMEYGVE